MSRAAPPGPSRRPKLRYLEVKTQMTHHHRRRHHTRTHIHTHLYIYTHTLPGKKGAGARSAVGGKKVTSAVAASLEDRIRNEVRGRGEGVMVGDGMKKA